MNQIIPNISSGNAILIFSNTICFNPKNGLILSIPVKNANDPSITLTSLNFNFTFTYNSDSSTEYKARLISSSTIEINLNNFGNILPAGIIKPLELKYGGTSLKCYFFAQKIHTDAEDALLNMTISFFSGEF